MLKYHEKLENLYRKATVLDLGDPVNGYFVTGNDQLQELSNIVALFMQRFGIGTKLSKKKWGKNRIGEIQNILQKAIEPSVGGAKETPAQVMARLDKAIKDPQGEFDRNDFERVARTEVAAMRAGFQLMTAQQLGFTKVQHIAKIDKKTGKQDLKYHSRVFDIDYLLKNEKDRIPLHPHCRCVYKLVRR